MDIFSIILLAIGFAALADFIYLNLDKRIPGTVRLPFIGDLAFVLWNWPTLYDFVAENARTFNLETRPFWLGRYRTWAITNPKDVEYVLKTNWKNYTVEKGIRGEALADLLGDGIFHVDGECWYTQRKTVSREFTMNNFRDFMLREFLHYSNMMRDTLLKGAKEGKSMDMQSMFFQLTLDSFGKVAFGVDLGGLAGVPQPFAKAFDEAQEVVAIRIAKKPPFIWKLEQLLNIGTERCMQNCLNTVIEFVSNLVEQRKKEVATSDEERQDLFARLFTISENEKDPQKRLKYLRDMCVNFMIAGRDTTACALSWLTYEVSKKPEIEASIVEELHDNFPTDDHSPSYDGLMSCHYIMAVIHETLRLHPSIPFPLKRIEKDDVLPSGVKVNAGETITYVSYAMGRQEAIWGPDATTFRPERFLDEEGRFVRPDQFKFPVFQAGPRLCLGMEMAILEMKAVIATLYRQMTFKLVKEPVYRPGIVLKMIPPGLVMQPIVREKKQ